MLVKDFDKYMYDGFLSTNYFNFKEIISEVIFEARVIRLYWFSYFSEPH